MADTKFIPLTGSQLSNNVELAPFMTKAFSADASMGAFVNALFSAAIAIGAMLAVLQLARAGFLYMTSDAWGQKDKAKHLIQDALVGLLLLLSVWLVLNQINPQLLNLDVLKGIEAIPSGGGSGGQNTGATGAMSAEGGVDNGCSTSAECNAESGLGPTPGIP